MQVVRIHQQGGPEVMQVEELPTPDPSQGQVRVSVAAAGVDFIDIYHRGGQYKVPLPFVLGREGAGIVDAVGSDEKAKLAREAGADEVILYREQDFLDEVKRLTGGAGVDVVYDSVGKDTFMKSLAALKRRGTLVLFGASSGAVPPFDVNELQ